MVEYETKTVKVPASAAEEWDASVEESPEIDSISHLIRMSVNHEINGTSDSGGQKSQEGGGSGEEMAEILTIVKQLQTSMDGVKSRLSNLESVESAEANYDLRKAVYSFLPEERDDLEYAEWAITTDTLARKLGADETDVRQALEQLDDTTGQVSSVTGGPKGETLWFKRAAQ